MPAGMKPPPSPPRVPAPDVTAKVTVEVRVASADQAASLAYWLDRMAKLVRTRVVTPPEGADRCDEADLLELAARDCSIASSVNR